MCKKCEIQGITMELEFLTIPSLKKMEQKLSQIKAWENLFKSGWHEEDLIQRAYAHLVWTMREAEKCNQPHWVTNARAFLSAMAKGFLNPFNPEQFKPKSGAPAAGGVVGVEPAQGGDRNPGGLRGAGHGAVDAARDPEGRSAV
jgi:hypothetical protein